MEEEGCRAAPHGPTLSCRKKPQLGPPPTLSLPMLLLTSCLELSHRFPGTGSFQLRSCLENHIDLSTSTVDASGQPPPSAGPRQERAGLRHTLAGPRMGLWSLPPGRPPGSQGQRLLQGQVPGLPGQKSAPGLTSALPPRRRAGLQGQRG